MAVSALFLLFLMLDRQKARLSPRQVLMKALFLLFPLAIGLWCTTAPPLVPLLPFYATSALLFYLALRGERENVQEVDVLNSERYIPPRERVERNVAYIILLDRSDQLPLLVQYYPRATLRPFTRPTGEIHFTALEVVDKEEVWSA